MTSDKIFEFLQQAVDEFYKRDKQLIQIGGLERTCVAHIAGYLQQIMDAHNCPKYLSVDCEYGAATDPNGNALKKYLDAFGVTIHKYIHKNSYATSDMRQVFPDIIIHKRQLQKDNFIVVEVKGWWNTDDWDLDRQKLECFTRKNSTACSDVKNYIRYKLGVFVLLGRNKPYYIQYRNGKHIGCDTPEILFQKLKKGEIK